MKHDKFWTTVILSALVFAISSSELVKADKLLLGGRTASMGGASAAQGRDSAMSYNNPAGFALVPHHTLSLSANIYRYDSYTIDEFFYHGSVNPDFLETGGLELPTVGKDGFESSGFEGFPGAASALWHFGDEDPESTHHVLSLSIIVPDHDRKTYIGEFELDFPSTIPLMDNVVMKEKNSFIFDRTVYLFGPGYALRVGPLRLGLNLFLSYAESIQSYESSSKVITSAAYIEDHSTMINEGFSLGMQPVVGAQLEVFKGLAFGLSFAPETIYLTSSTNAVSQYNFSAPDENFVETTKEKGTWEYKRPMRIRAGIGYEVPRKWALALDTEFTMAQEPASKNQSDITKTTQVQGSRPIEEEEEFEVSVDRDGVVNLYLGGEVFVTDILALRGGFYLEPPTVPYFQNQESEIFDISVYRLGGTLGLGMESDVGEVTFGVGFSTGKTETVAFDIFSEYPSIDYPTTSVDYYSVTFFLSGTVDFEEFGAAIDIIRDPGAVFDLGDKRKISLSSLDVELSRFEDNLDINALKTEVVEYYQIGEYRYDEFFERVARIRASIKLAGTLLSKVKEQLRKIDPSVTSEDIAEIIRMVNERDLDINDIKGVQELKEIVSAINIVRGLLGRLSKDIAELPRLGNRLIERAKQDLEGPEVVKVTAVVNGLYESIGDAYQAIQEMPGVLSELLETAEALDRLYLLNPNLKTKPNTDQPAELDDSPPSALTPPHDPRTVPGASKPEGVFPEPKPIQSTPGNEQPSSTQQ